MLYLNKLLLFLSFSLLQGTFLYAQDIPYSVFSIPKDLSNNANAVIRKEVTDIQVLSYDRMLVKKEKIVSVLNSNGIPFTDFVVFYTDFDKIKKIKINIFDAFGKKIKSIRRDDIKDYSAEDNYTLYNDTRVLYYRYIPNNFPYSVAISYTKDSRNTAFIPPFKPVKDFRLGIENSSFSITYPSDITLHVKEQNLKKYHIDKQNTKGLLSYKLTKVNPIFPEDYMPAFRSLVPMAKVALNRFSLAGIKGSADSWEEMGNWIIDRLLKGRNTVTKKTRDEILELTKNLKDPVEKAKKIYRYMQNKTRYISIQIGIGGWRPMPALEVDKKGYGDCKALVNYTKSLMDIAGVDSYYTIVYGGKKRDIDSDWVAMQGNHAILMLPTQKDTMWLECTNQKLPFGHIVGFTDDRKVFVVNSHKSYIKKTTKYPDSTNKVITKAIIDIHPDMSLEAQVHITNCGAAYNDVYRLQDIKPEKQKMYYKDYFSGLLNLNIQKIDFEDLKKQNCFKQNISLQNKSYVSNFVKNEFYFRPNIFTVFGKVPPKIENRRYQVVITEGFKHLDEITWHLPEGFTVDYRPEDLIIKSDFGNYKRQIIKKDTNTIIYKRSFLLKSGTYSKESYNKFRKFIKSIKKSDMSKIILKKIS